MRALRTAASEGTLILCECVLAEIRPAFDEQQFLLFRQEWPLVFVPSSEESSILAGTYFADYLNRRGAIKAIVPDFLIGAHALIHADRLLARDRGYLRDFFSSLTVFFP
jgi:predicted nucleic acid-binding protein